MSVPLFSILEQTHFNPSSLTPNPLHSVLYKGSRSLKEDESQSAAAQYLQHLSTSQNDTTDGGYR